MLPLRLGGVMKVAEGATTLDEVLRTTPHWQTTPNSALP
jgi:general secretion pathway protein E